MNFSKELHRNAYGPRVAKFFLVSPEGRVKTLGASSICHHSHLVIYSDYGSRLTPQLTTMAREQGWTELEQDYKAENDQHGWEQWLSYIDACENRKAEGEFPEELLPQSVRDRRAGKMPSQRKWAPEPRPQAKGK